MTDPPLRKSGRPALVSLLPSGEVRSAAVVRRLDMSVRTFTRNLAAKGMTFAEMSSGYGSTLPLAIWRITGNRSSRSPGCRDFEDSDTIDVLRRGLLEKYSRLNPEHEAAHYRG